MNEKDEKRLRELLDEVSQILNSESPKAHRLKLSDILKEFKEIAERKEE